MRRVLPPELSEVPTLVRLLRRCLQRSAQGKRGARRVARVLVDPEPLLRHLAETLSAGVYRPRAGRAFWIRDPKPRCIFALPFPDRVVQHLLISGTLPDIERRLVQQTYACRTGLGTHRCLQRAAALCRTAGYVLRVDIRKYFPSIDHQILRRQLVRVTAPGWHALQERLPVRAGGDRAGRLPLSGR